MDPGFFFTREAKRQERICAICLFMLVNNAVEPIAKGPGAFLSKFAIEALIYIYIYIYIYIELILFTLITDTFWVWNGRSSCMWTPACFLSKIFTAMADAVSRCWKGRCSECRTLSGRLLAHGRLKLIEWSRLKPALQLWQPPVTSKTWQALGSNYFTLLSGHWNRYENIVRWLPRNKFMDVK